MPADDVFSDGTGGAGFLGDSTIAPFAADPDIDYYDQWGRRQWLGETYGLDPRSAQYAYRDKLGGLGQGMRDQAQQYYDNLSSGRDSAAQQQMQLGLGQAQRAMQQAAVARGSNPLAQRAAVYGGGQMAQQGVTEAAMLRAQEMRGARKDVLGAMGGQVDIEQGLQAREQHYRENQRKLEMQQQAMEYAKEQGESDLIGSIATGLGTAAMSAAGSIGAAAAKGADTVDSDKRAKQNAYEMGRQDQDALARQLGGGTPQQNDVANQLARRIGGADTPELRALGAEVGGGAAPWGRGSYPVKPASIDAGRAPERPVSYPISHETRQQVAGEQAALDQNRGRLDKAGISGMGQAFDPTRPLYEQEGSVLDRTARNMDLHGFEYKPGIAGSPSAPAGQRAGVMAQDLEQDPLARQVVGSSGGMKNLDVPNALGLSLGLHGRTAERLDDLDRRVRRG